MKKDITPEMYNYNKYPGPKFERLMDQVRSKGIELTLVENYKEAFDVTAFEQRFTAFMLKFNYIVGDWGNEQLRLKGFYKDEKTEATALKISRLEDYLLEYCNYGCAYFVLENPNPQVPEVEVEEPMRSPRNRDNGQRRRRRPRHRNGQTKEMLDKQGKQTPQRDARKRPDKAIDQVRVQAQDSSSDSEKAKPKRSRRRNNRSKQEKRHFDIKSDKKASQPKQAKKEVDVGKRDFVIRQK